MHTRSSLFCTTYLSLFLSFCSVELVRSLLLLFFSFLVSNPGVTFLPFLSSLQAFTKNSCGLMAPCFIRRIIIYSYMWTGYSHKMDGRCFLLLHPLPKQRNGAEQKIRVNFIILGKRRDWKALSHITYNIFMLYGSWLYIFL